MNIRDIPQNGFITYFFNGVDYDAARTPNKFIPFNGGIDVTLNVWTPIAGKRFRLMGLTIGFNTANVAPIQLRDAGVAFFNISCDMAGTTTLALNNNGYFSSAINNTLSLFSGTALQTARGTLWGCEE